MRPRGCLTRPVPLLLTALLVAAAAGTGPAWSAETGKEAAERAEAGGELAGRMARHGPAEAAGICGPLLEIRRPSGQLTCTPGPESLSDISGGHDHDGLPVPLNPVPPARSVVGGVPCEGDGQDGNRVQAVYAYPVYQEDRYNLWVDSIRDWAIDADAVFQASAARTGGMRRVRFVTEGPCRLSVLRLPVPAGAEDTFWGTVAALENAGLVRPDRKYLVWMDSDEICGQAELWIDDRPGAENRNNGHPDTVGGIARIDSPCWGLGPQGRSVEAHELMHLLGGVQPTAPHGTGSGHCVDDADRMCYADDSVDDTSAECSKEGEALFDCDADDYFHTDPPPGSYLADHWNPASSSFLTKDEPSLNVDDVSVHEGVGANGRMVFTAWLSAPPRNVVTAQVHVIDGQARVSEDYSLAQGALTFPRGVQRTTIEVDIRDDKVGEIDETFVISVTRLVNAAPGRLTAIGTIIDDDR